jgi:hypothetical protein
MTRVIAFVALLLTTGFAAAQQVRGIEVTEYARNVDCSVLFRRPLSGRAEIHYGEAVEVLFALCRAGVTFDMALNSSDRAKFLKTLRMY